MDFISFLRKDFQKNSFWYCFVLFVPIVVYIYDMANFPLTQDELRRFNSMDVDPEWIKQGRWGMYVLTKLFLSNPVFPAVGIYISSVAALISIRLITNVSKLNIEYVCLFSIVFVTYPSLIFLYSFSTVSFSVGIIYLISTLSVLLLFSSKLSHNLLSVIFLSVAISIYQSSLTLFATLFFITLLLKISDDKNNYRSILKFFFVTIAALILYFISVRLSLMLLGSSSSGYVSGFVEIGTSLDYYFSLFYIFVKSLGNYYINPHKIYLSRNYAQTILTVFAILFLLRYFIKSKTWIGCLCVVMIIIAPLSFNLLSKHDIPTRSLIALPLSVSFIIFYCFFLLKNRKLKLAMLALVAISTVYNLVIINRLSFSDSNSWKNDTLTAQLMISRVYSLTNLDSVDLVRGKIPIHLAGYKFREQTPFYRESENIGKGFFAWGANELQNITNLFGSLGHNEFVFAELDTVRPIISEIRRMPIWPKQGSVKIIDGVAVVKVSDYTESQYSIMCNQSMKQNSRTHSSCSVSYNPQSIPFYFTSGSEISTQNVLFDVFRDEFIKLRGARLISANGSLNYTPTIGDSQVIFPSITNKDNILLSLELVYSRSDVVEFYFKNGRPDYFFNNVLRLKVHEGLNIINIVLPSYFFKEQLRMDLTNGIDKIKLNKLTLEPVENHLF